MKQATTKDRFPSCAASSVEKVLSQSYMPGTVAFLLNARGRIAKFICTFGGFGWLLIWDWVHYCASPCSCHFARTHENRYSPGNIQTLRSANWGHHNEHLWSQLATCRPHGRLKYVRVGPQAVVWICPCPFEHSRKLSPKQQQILNTASTRGISLWRKSHSRLFKSIIQWWSKTTVNINTMSPFHRDICDYDKVLGTSLI